MATGTRKKSEKRLSDLEKGMPFRDPKTGKTTLKKMKPRLNIGPNRPTKPIENQIKKKS